MAELTEYQKSLRIKFRRFVLENWAADLLMFNVIDALAAEFNISSAEIFEQLAKIKSIGYVLGKQKTRVWLAHNYPKVSDACFEGDMRAAQALFVTKNHFPIQIKKPEKRSARRFENKINAIRTLNAEKGDRWSKTSWTKCK